MRPISQARFDAMVTYAREPLARYMMHEKAWFEAGREQVLGALVVDTDGEYSGVILGRDRDERYRAIALTTPVDTIESAITDLHNSMEVTLLSLQELREQGDETGKPVDFFTPVVNEERLSPNFKTVALDSGFAPARGIISEMMRWHQDVDGNFVEQFQTSGFDARIWELYLFAAMRESELMVEQPAPAPDFLCSAVNGMQFFLEATTINPSKTKDGHPVETPRPETNDELTRYVQHFLPTKYAGPLTTKLGKRYWTSPEVQNKPLAFAIQDFHDTMSMTRSKAGLGIYLYGFIHDPDGSPRKISEHIWGSKKVPSGFFTLDNSEHISAVIFNASGTLSKFNRMGVAAGFGSGDVVLVRKGHRYDPSPNASSPLPYQHVVTEGYPETWMQGMEVFHNPHALNPLDPELLPDAVHNHLLNNGKVSSSIPAWPGWAPLNSFTSVITLS